MNRLFNIYKFLHDEGVKMYSWPLGQNRAGTIEVNSKYAIFIDEAQLESTAEEAVIAAHEAGHIATGATHRISSPIDLIERHEYKADQWAAKKLVPPDELRAALNDGIDEYWELAEKFDVTEDFMRRVVEIYRASGDLPRAVCRGKHPVYTDPEMLDKLRNYFDAFERWQKEKPFGPNYKYTLEQYSFLWDHRNSLSNPKKFLCLN